MSDPVSALSGAAAEAGLSIRIEDAGLQGMIALRGDAASPAFRKAVEGAVAPLPEIRRVSTRGDRTLLWMAPDEWLALVPHGDAAAVLTDLGEAMAGEHHLAVDVSDARAVFRLTGDGVREALAKGAPVDLSRAAFGVGDLRRTDVAGARSLLMRSVRIRARYDDDAPLPEADYVVDSHAALRALLGV